MALAVAQEETRAPLSCICRTASPQVSPGEVPPFTEADGQAYLSCSLCLSQWSQGRPEEEQEVSMG